MSRQTSTSPETPRRPRARRLAPRVRQDQLLGCAVRAFGKTGVASTRHADVAAEAGVSLSTVFLYFPTREALRRAVAEELDRWAVELARSVHTPEVAPEQALYDHLARFADLLEEHPEYARVWFGWSSAIEDDLWWIYRRLQRRIERIVAATVRRGQHAGTIAVSIHPTDAARLIIGAGYVIAQARFTGRPHAELERLARGLVDLMRIHQPVLRGRTAGATKPTSA